MKKYKLEDLCKEIIDCPHSTPNWKSEGVRVIRNFNIKNGRLDFSDGYFVDEDSYKERTRRAIPEANDLVISREAPMGAVCIVPDNLKCCLGQRLVLLKIDDSICDSKYLLFSIQSDYVQKQIEVINKTGSIVSNLNISDLKKLMIPYRSLPDQQKIAAVLSSLDDKIALNNRINAKLEQMAKRLYDYWFVQFDFPNTDGNPYKSSGGKMVWNEILKREIPDGWEVGNLYDIAEYVNGLACQNYRPKESEKSLPVIKIREMNEGITADTEKVSASIPGKYRIYAGDILFSWSASLEIKIWTGETGGLNQHIFKVIPKGYFSKGYVYQQLSAYLVNFQKMAESRKTTMGHITSDHIKQSRILIPPKEIISAFTKKTLSIFNYQLSIEKETQKLTALRDRLLPLLMNGQVEVK